MRYVDLILFYPHSTNREEHLSATTMEATVQQQYFAFPASAFPRPPDEPQICAERDCQISLPFSKVLIFGFRQNNSQWVYMCFCGTQHTLECLPASHLNQA